MTEYMRKLITAIVLAGGESSRMGRDKALLPLGNQTLLSQICHVALECATQVYVVTPWIEKYQHIVPKNCQLISEKLLLPNQNSNSPIIGLLQALPLVSTDWVLLLACDLPKLQASQIKQWYTDLTRVSTEKIALLPRNFQGWEPLCGFYRCSCLPLLEAYVAAGGRSFQNFLAQHPVAELHLRDRTFLFNCNTPEDWEQMIREEVNQ